MMLFWVGWEDEMVKKLRDKIGISINFLGLIKIFCEILTERVKWEK